MSFSRAQQGLFQPLKKAAWKVAAARGAGAFEDKSALDLWYRRALRDGLGVESTTGLDVAGGFERAMLLFAELAEDFSQVMHWQKKVSGGDVARVLFVLREAVPGLVPDAGYIEGVCRRMFGRGLGEISPEERRRLIVALKMHAGRAAEGDLPSGFQRDETQPF